MDYMTIIISIFLLFACVSILFYIGLRNSISEWNHLWLNSVVGWIRLFCRYYHRYDLSNIPVPESGGAIIVSNHISGLDPLLLAAATNRPIRFLIAKEEYYRFGLTWLFRAGGCIPIDRSGNVVRAMSAAIQALKNGEILALFPEGQIHSAEQDKKPIKRGVALLAEATNSLIYPVHISGIRGHGHVLRGLAYRSKVKLIFGEKISCVNTSDKECLNKISEFLHPK